MGFVTIEDIEGSVEATLLPETFRQGAPHLRAGGPLLVRGRLESETGARKLLAEDVRPLPAEGNGVAEPPRSFTLRVPYQADLAALRGILDAHPGPVPVELWVEVGGGAVLIRSKSVRVGPSRDLVGAVEALLGAAATDRTE